MNEPNESEFEISVPEGATIEEALPEAPAQDAPVPEVPGSVTYVLPEGYITAKAPEPQPASVEVPAEEPPPEEPEIVRHDPFAYMRGAPWMNRKLSPSGRAAAFARRELKAFPVIEGRDPNHADLDAIVKRTVDYMVPIFKHERATDIAYDELEKRRAARIAEKQRVAQAAATASPASGGGSIAGAALKETAKRVAPFLATAPAGVLAPAIAAAVLLKPSTSETGSYDLGDDLRFRVPPGSLQGEIERRIGGRWERVGTAELNGGAGPRLLVESTTALANAVGAQMAGRLLSQGIVGKRVPSSPAGDALRAAIAWKSPGDVEALDALGPESSKLPVVEMRYLSLEKGAVPRFGEIEKDDVGKFCPNYPLMQRIGIEAGDLVRQRGLVRALDYGTQTHFEARKQVERVTDLLKANGVKEIYAEFAMRAGGKIRFMVKGGVKVDVIEFLDGGRTICIYDFKTGGARFKDTDMIRYEREGRMFGESEHYPHPNVYVFPVFIPGMDGVMRQP